MNQIDRAISDFLMFDKGKKVVVGFSGGADSVTLLHYLKFHLEYDVIACHVNHHLRGAESMRDKEFAEKFCNQYGIKLFITDADVSGYAKKFSLTTEEAGRNLRYEAFFKLLAEENADYIATAHTLSDNAETLLLNLTRGTGLQGLCGIPPVRGKIVRPLIYCTRLEIESYCNENGLSYVVDSTNADAKYSRNNIRQNVIPVLKQINPSFELTIKRNIDIFRVDNNYMQCVAKLSLEKARLKDGYDCNKIKVLDIAIRQRIIALILDDFGDFKSTELIRSIDGMITSQAGKINLSLNKFISVKNGVLTIRELQSDICYFEDSLVLGEYFAKSGDKYEISEINEEILNSLKKVYRNLLYILMDYGKIKGNIIIRQRKSGDSVEFFNRVGKRSLKKLFIDEKLTSYEKSKTLVFEDEQGIIGVFPFGIAKRVAIDSDTKSVLMIKSELG